MTNPDMRKSLEIGREKMDKNQVVLSWDGLDEALQLCSKTLCQGRKLSADFYKLLVYRDGDFFKYHYDSKKGENHLLTIVVSFFFFTCVYLLYVCIEICKVDLGLSNCVGGELRFRCDDNERFLEDHETDFPSDVSWVSDGCGSFCGFFLTQQHAVKQISSGCRVVATFNVFCCDENPRVDLRPSTRLLPYPFSALGSDVFVKVLQHLDFRSMIRLLTCSKVSSVLANPEFVLANLITGRKNQLLSEAGSNLRALGYVFQHQVRFFFSFFFFL